MSQSSKDYIAKVDSSDMEATESKNKVKDAGVMAAYEANLKAGYPHRTAMSMAICASQKKTD